MTRFVREFRSDHVAFIEQLRTEASAMKPGEDFLLYGPRGVEETSDFQEAVKLLGAELWSEPDDIDVDKTVFRISKPSA